MSNGKYNIYSHEKDEVSASQYFKSQTQTNM